MRPGQGGGRAGRRAGVAALVLVGLLAGGCATTPAHPVGGADGLVTVVAVENFWGSLAAQVGGERARVRSLLDNPDADPHDYEPGTADGRALVSARLTVVNGVGYDPWASRLTAASPDRDRVDLVVGDVVGAHPGDNPHRWYSPADVRAVIDALTGAYQRLDPAHAEYYAGRRDTVLRVDLAGYFGLIDDIRGRYAGTPVGATESIFALLAPALGLDLITPPRYLAAVSEGDEPTLADRATVQAQLRDRRIAVYVSNIQNSTPDVRAQVAAARAHDIPVTTITETLVPAGASFQDWQVSQLEALRAALAAGTGR
jgi:zinc/manganese transport system substrate-binding protein